ncbi:LuxR family transcriptional regulator [Sphingomonas antarctica]|uniref:LuxR C-terminal-related transcriptional regulator n=1 Tax=Sphingomonas antarctica TaxID=2040274 RepID=UPI0039EBF0E5
MKTCLVADDHVMMRDALAGTVRLVWPEVAIVEVGDFPGAWTAAKRSADIAIVDLMMPGAMPREGIKTLREAAPDMPILVITGTDDDRLMMDLLALGIAGFAAKTSNSSVIEAALRLIDAGGRYLPPRLAEIATSRHAASAGFSDRRPSDGSVGANLTDRQRDVLRLVARGLSNKEIASELKLAPETVKTHLARIQTILGARNRTDAVTRAREL